MTVEPAAPTTGAGTGRRGSPVRLRRPTEDDLDEVWRVHGDPRTNVHNPAGPDADRAVSRARLRGWLGHWAAHGFGYSVVETADGAVAGFCGVRHDRWLGRPVLNLYYRLAPEAWGRGLATAAARSAVGWAREQRPDLPVLAYTTLGNVASQRTAAAAGLARRRDLELELDGLWAVVFATGSPDGAAGNGSPATAAAP